MGAYLKQHSSMKSLLTVYDKLRKTTNKVTKFWRNTELSLLVEFNWIFDIEEL